MKSSSIDIKHCVHCGDEIGPHSVIQWKNHRFCCDGCKMVYQLLSEHDMLSYYAFEETPGSSLRLNKNPSFEYLDDPNILIQLTKPVEGTRSRITLKLPQIHCSSCLWLLENISRLNNGIIFSRVNFLAKEATFMFDTDKITLRQLVELLSKIGYEPKLQLDSLDESSQGSNVDRSIYYKLGYAGFAFGNIMLLSFPEYLGFEQASFKMYIGYINILLAIPVLLYSGRDYLKSAFVGIKQNHLNIDVPVAIGMITLFIRSLYEILSHTGEGYLDSFAGLIFFLLIGRWFQSYTQKALDFDRGYQSYFPISATIWEGTRWTTKVLDLLKKGDRLLIRNQELIPTDGILTKGRGRVDYSFVTGESDLISKEAGDIILAGGKQMGSSIEMLVNKPVDQSYLVQLWGDDVFRKSSNSATNRLISGISRYFTYVIIGIAIAALAYWWSESPGKAVNVFTAVLIVACPCALALAIPFTYGNVLRLLSSSGLFLRNVNTIEDIQDIDTLVFDKTGTITDSNTVELQYEGSQLAIDQQSLIKSTCTHSSHPLSKAIAAYLEDAPLHDLDVFEDIIGKGLIAHFGDNKIKIGSSFFIFGQSNALSSSEVLVEINDEYVGRFSFQHKLRNGLEENITSLDKKYDLYVLSGDNDEEKFRMEKIFGRQDRLIFNQSPKEKLAFIKTLQSNGAKVMMIGDGLNDAGALKQSDVGLVISDDVNNFSPSCDGILSGESFDGLSIFLKYLTQAKQIIFGALILALLYNGIGLSYALGGFLSPVIAAILMPISSITVMIYGVAVSYWAGRTIWKKYR